MTLKKHYWNSTFIVMLWDRSSIFFWESSLCLLIITLKSLLSITEHRFDAARFIDFLIVKSGRSSSKHQNIALRKQRSLSFKLEIIWFLFNQTNVAIFRRSFSLIYRSIKILFWESNAHSVSDSSDCLLSIVYFDYDLWISFLTFMLNDFKIVSSTHRICHLRCQHQRLLAFVFASRSEAFKKWNHELAIENYTRRTDKSSASSRRSSSSSLLQRLYQTIKTSFDWFINVRSRFTSNRIFWICSIDLFRHWKH